ncbi:MAG: glycerate kinase [Bacteroidota bacterium]
MKVLIAPDKFKGSLTAQEVCNALAKGLKKANSEVEIITRPMADGGDGSLEVLSHYLDGKTITVEVEDPLFRPIEASYLLVGTTAYIEMAAASGLALLKKRKRDCTQTTSYGTGELILDAIRKGATTIYLFIGGSATNEAGMGIASALGYLFYSKSGEILVPIGENLQEVAKIDGSFLFFKKEKIDFKVVCDVNNPFYGENGAAYVYAPQKGASPQTVKMLDRGLHHFAEQLTAHGYPDVANVPGAGAAGGIGGGAIALLEAALVSGITTFLEITALEKAIKNCDLIITGEGNLDAQTEQGKVISGVCALAKKYDKPVIAVCGDADQKAAHQLNLSKVYTIMERVDSLEVAIESAAIQLEAIGEQLLQKLSLSNE